MTRPGQTCGSDEPEDGCATIDWSDDPAKPNVPPGGRFENRVTVDLAAGARDFFLSASGSLVGTPDVIDPTREHTAIPGAGVSWSAELPSDAVGGGELRMRLFLTKWLDPAVEIGYEVSVG